MSKKELIQKPFWIIKNIVHRKIWKQIYLSRSEAENELKYQLSMLPSNKTGKNWIIEECSFMGEKDGLDDF